MLRCDWVIKAWFKLARSFEKFYAITQSMRWMRRLGLLIGETEGGFACVILQGQGERCMRHLTGAGWLECHFFYSHPQSHSRPSSPRSQQVCSMIGDTKVKILRAPSRILLLPWTSWTTAMNWLLQDRNLCRCLTFFLVGSFLFQIPSSLIEISLDTLVLSCDMISNLKVLFIGGPYSVLAIHGR